MNWLGGTPRMTGIQLRRTGGAALALGMVVSMGGALAQSSGPGLSDISLEELMNIEVSSVSRKQQKLSEAAAAVYVITGDDIRRSGAGSIPEALRMAPGLQVAQIDANKWAVSARGFSGRSSNKMLVLIDGRSVYNLLYYGVYWDQNDVLLEDVDRIEVIRGPGATMWGANAVNGVINIITKSSQETQGALISSSVGNLDRPSAAFRVGGRAGERVTYRTYTKYTKRGNMATASGADAHDGWNSLRGGGRVDWEINGRDSFTAQGDVYRGTANESAYDTFPLVGIRPAVPVQVRTSGGFGMARWNRVLSERSTLAVQAFVDRQRRREWLGGADLLTADVEFQHRLSFANRHDLMWGGGYRHSLSRAEIVPGSRFRLDPLRRNDHLFSVFVQDEITLVPDQLLLTIGSKFQHNSYTGLEIQPSLRVAYLPSPQQALWGAVSRAVRTPSRAESDLYVEYPLPGGPTAAVGRLTGNPNNRSEAVVSYEAGYRNQPWKHVSVDLAGFYSVYTHLIGAQALAPEFQLSPVRRLVVPSMFTGGDSARTWGAEIAATISPIPKWKLHANYTWMNLRYVNRRSQVVGLDPANSAPRGQVQLRSGVDLSRRLNWDGAVYYVSALGGSVPSYVRLDTRLGWRLTEQLELSVVGQNLLDGRHLEFLPEDYVLASQIRRAFLVRLLWIF